MTLKEWLHKNNYSCSMLAKIVCSSPTHINRIANKTVNPSESIAYAIHMVTNGQVSFSEIRNA